VESGDVEMTDAKKQQQVLKFWRHPWNMGSEICEKMGNFLL